MDAGTVSSSIDSSTTLVVAFLAMLGVTVPPIVVALINRSGKSHEVEPPSLDLIDDLDHQLDRLTREVLRKDDQIERLTRENERLRSEQSRREFP